MAIRASLSLPEVLSTATRELGRALSASRVHLYLYNSEDVGSPLEHEYLGPALAVSSPCVVTYDDPIGHQLSRLKPSAHYRRRPELCDAQTLSDYVRAAALASSVFARKLTIRCS